MRKFTKKPIQAETEDEMSARHVNEELNTLNRIHKSMYELMDALDELHEHAYETMELGALYEELNECLRSWRTNFKRLDV